MKSLKYISFFWIYIYCSCQVFSQVQSYAFTPVFQWKGGISSSKTFNDVIGWYDSINHKEYAIIGELDSIFFFDVTNENQVKLCDTKAGRSKGCINRDFEIYQNYLYSVADEGKASLQIFDLSFLPDSVVKVYDHDSLTNNTHNIYREGTKLYLSKTRILNKIIPLVILDISDPAKPYKLGEIVSPLVSGVQLFSYVHDASVKNDTAYCSCGTDGLYIYDCSTPSKPKYINSFTQYPNAGYNHSSALHATKPILYFTDENKGSGVKVLSLLNLFKPDVKTILQASQGSIPHNTYIKDSLLFVSYYQEGVKVYHLSNAEEPVEVGSYDTYPENAPGDFQGFKGCWSVYPWLPSGLVLASDTKNGLFILRMTKVNSIFEAENAIMYLSPNPTTDYVYIQTQGLGGWFNLKVYNIWGELIMSQPVSTSNFSIDFSKLSSGIYTIQMSNGQSKVIKKMVKQ